MDTGLLLLVYTVCCLMLPTNIVGLWWVVGGQLLMEPEVICRKRGRLAGKQRQICRREPELVRHVAVGARLAVRECQKQFTQRRWNCTTARRSIARILKKDTREAAFVWAISAAGAMYSVTKGCSQGKLPGCKCVQRKSYAGTGKIIWMGCNDDVKPGYNASRDFMDYEKRRHRRSDIRTRIHLHNNEAGRLAVLRSLGRSCKCHGLSGSCSMKTCFRRLLPFHTVGARLKQLFDGAIKVIGNNDGNSLLPAGETLRPPNRTDLIYAEESPNFCRRNRRQGSLGTSGRVCDPVSAGVGGCEILCCGRGYRKYTRQDFHQTCRLNQTIYKVTCEDTTVERTEYSCV